MRRYASLALLLVFFLALGFTAPSSSAQAVFGSVIGNVTDAQGNAVAGAKVTVTSIGKATSYEATSNESGNFAVTHLIPDTYKVTIEAAGFKVYAVDSIQVSADSSVNVNASLEVGAVTQTVEVTGDIPQLKTDRADVAIEFSQKYIADLPVLNRNFTSFELLSPGTQKLPGFNHAATENPQGGGQIQVNGQHFSGTNFELDGTDNQDPILGIIVVNPNLDAIAEAKLALQDYDAESGKATSGIIKVQTKSGSNEFHGTGFYYYRNSDQQATDPFTPRSVPLAAANWKQFGGSVGGPIIKDKLFFFGDYQGTKQQQGITNQYTIPTAEVIKTCNPATNTAPGATCDLSQYLNINGPGTGQIYNPNTGTVADGSGRTPFPNNQIPIGMISQNVGNVLALFPTAQVTDPTSPNFLTNNFSASGSGPFDQKSFDTRIDYSAPHNFQVFGRFSLDYFSLSGKGGLGVLGSEGFGPGGLNGSSNVHNYSLATGFTKPIGTKWLTDVRFGYFKYNPQTAYSDAGTNVMTTLGFPGLNLGTPETGGTSGFIFQVGGNGSGVQGGLGSNSTGTYGFGDGLNVGRCNCPLTESEQQFQVVNNWTRTQGNHTIKFGADIRYAMNLRVPSDQSRTGLLYFDQYGTGDSGSQGLALATFLLGDVNNFQRYVSQSTNAAERQKRWFFYGQDSWRVSPKFTMTYGLRWEIYFPETVNAKGNGGFANLNDGLINVANYANVGSNGNVSNTYKAFAPRLSFAYQFDPKTVLRVGYGRGFDIGVFGSNYGHVVTQNLPVLARQDLADTNINPAYTNNRSAIFTLNQGPPAFDFSPIIGAIQNGTLPINGIDGSTQGGARPLVQRLPTIDQWNGTVQRQLTPTLNITVSYVGNKGTHVFAGTGPSYNNNEVQLGGGTSPIVCDPTCHPKFTPFLPASFRTRYFMNGVPAFTYPTFTYVNPLGVTTPTPPCCSGGTTYYGNDASNNYNALQVQAEKRVSHGLEFLAHYTFSHAFAYDTNQYSTPDKKYAWGPNPYNRNQVFVANIIYELPVGKGKKFMSDAGRAMDLIIGGWQITNTTTYGTGLPWTPTINEGGNVSDVDANNRPNFVVGQSRLSTGVSHSGGGTYWFQSVAPLTYGSVLTPANAGLDTCTLARPVSGPFALPACGQIGNVGFNSYRGPHAFYDDMALSKNFTITERVRAQFRFDAYNVFNHPVLGVDHLNTCVDCGTQGGQISDIESDSAPGAPVGMRQLQFGVKVIF
jgi:hypothetical protein